MRRVWTSLLLPSSSLIGFMFARIRQVREGHLIAMCGRDGYENLAWIGGEKYRGFSCLEMSL